ncbi:MAG: aminotransferase class I/II-fold pyridoxal phosphate-dependent enzyme [Candidatus Aminicenantes bacterium]|nr:aminotransferase class I/II-fold pyridoxal phosphate-dependent enzyme [Candidatus Aminicenantes bacterium]
MTHTDTIPHSRPLVAELDLEAVVSALESGQISQGPAVDKFEKALAEYIGQNKAAATNSGTAALHLALLALDVKEKDEIIIPSFVCSAVLNAVNHTGATPVIADIELLTYNLSVESVKKTLTQKTKAIIVPHMFGCPAEMNKFLELDIPIIEDCAQAIGATFKGQKVGSLGLLSIFSFYTTKVMACGEGGMVLSDAEDLILKIKDLREYDNKDDYLVRYNYKMTDIQAALGLSQLSSLNKFVARRKEIAALYFEEFKDCDFSLPVWKQGKEHIYYRFVIRIKDDISGYLEKFQQKGIICRRPVYKPLHLYLNLPGFPQTTEAWQKAISIPLYPSLTEEEIDRIIEAVKDIF